MNKGRCVTERRGVDRIGAPHASTRDYQRAIEQELRFRVIRATDAVPGRKTWREKRARTDRVPFRAELEIARTVMDRAVWTGNADTVERASEELFDLALAFVRCVSRIITDGRERVGQIESGRAA